MIRHQTPSRSAGQRKGIVAVLVAVSLFILVGALAFAIDGGYMFEKKHVVTSAAEAAAYAAANLLFENYDEWEGKDPEHKAYNLAMEYAASNGFANGGKNTVTVNIPPATGDYAGKVGFVEVIIRHQFPQTFSSVFSRGQQTITGRAVAAGTMGASKASILVLEPTQKHAVAIKGASLKLAGDLVVNSKNKKAMQLDKKGQIKAENILVTGGIDRGKKDNLNLQGELTTGVEATSNPLSGLKEPADGPGRHIADYLTMSGTQRMYDLPPGKYDGKIEFKKNDVVNLQPGTYKFNDDVRFREQSSVTGDGVTLYMDGKKAFRFETTGSVNLSPPTSGAYEGVTLFMDPTQKNKIYFKRDADLNISGSIYAANGEVKFQQVDADLGFVDTDPDADNEELTDFSDDWLPESTGSIAAYIIARKLKIDKKSQVEILGAGIDVKAPFLGLVE